MQADLKFYENLLRKIEDDDSIVLSNITTKNACGKGDNFISEVLKITLQGRKKNGDYNKSMVAKQLVDNDVITKFKFRNLFKNECVIYNELFPALQRRSKCMIKPPKHFYADENILLFEDLHLEGFELKPRGYRFSLEECKLVLTEISKLHAASISLHEKEPMTVQKLTEQLHYFHNSEQNDALEECYNHHIIVAIKLFERDPSPVSSKALSCLTRLRDDNNYKKMYDIFENPTPIKVFNHGDLWGNNIFFKNDELRLVDYQLVRFASPGLDLSYFLWTNLDAKLRKLHNGELIEYYLEKLKQHCLENDVKQETISRLDLSWIEKEMTLFSLLGLTTSFLFMPVFFMNPDDYMEDELIDPDVYINRINDQYKENVMQTVFEYMEYLDKM